MIREKKYLQCIIISHGKSEVDLFGCIKQNLRLKIEIVSDKKGSKSVQINSLIRFLDSHRYSTLENFLNYFSDIPLINKKIDPNFKIFIVMDTDDIEKEENLRRYLSKEMFKKYPLYEYIVPIYNTPNLEDVFEETGHVFKNKGDERKKEYKDLLKPYPTPELARNYLKDLEERLRKCKDTNLDELIEFILNIDKL